MQKAVKILEVVVVSWWEVRWIWQNFVAQFVQLFKHWLWDVWSGFVIEKNWALSVDQCWLQALQFSEYCIDLLNILLRCNGFTGIQKAVVDQNGSRLPDSDHDLFWYKFGFGKCFGAASWSSPWAGHCWLFYTIHLVSHHIQLRNGLLLHTREDNTSEWRFFLIAVSLWGTHLLSF